MWANSFLLTSDRLLDGTAINGIHFANHTPESPNAILIQVGGKDWYGSPKYFTRLEWQRIAIDFSTCTGAMNLSQPLCSNLNDSERQRITSFLAARYPRAWNHSKSQSIVRRLFL